MSTIQLTTSSIWNQFPFDVTCPMPIQNPGCAKPVVDYVVPFSEMPVPERFPSDAREPVEEPVDQESC